MHPISFSSIFKTLSFSSIFKKLSFSSISNRFPFVTSLPTLSFSSIFTSEMEFNPNTNAGSYVDLLFSQSNVVFGTLSDSVSPSSSKVPYSGTEDSVYEDTQTSRSERRTWTHTDDVVLISSWLNTSKDPVIGNEQRSRAFWKRIAEYFNQSPKVAGCEKREPSHCKNRWQKINDLVCKYCGSYEAATRQKTSGQNENDVIKLSHQIFLANYKKKFTLEHCWNELRTDQKWCQLSTTKNEGSSKKRKASDGSPSASSPVHHDDAVVERPPGVKASKARVKKPIVEGKDLSDFQTMWTIKKEDLAVKERLGKMKILESLIAKTGALADYEESLKKKLVNELL